MPSKAIVLAGACVLFCLPAVAEPNFFAPSPEVRRKLDDAVAQARQSHRRLWVTYGGTWCGMCGEMDRALESEPNIAHYVRVRVDCEDLGALQQYAKTLRIDLKPETAPLMAVLETDGSRLLEAVDGARYAQAGHLVPARLKETVDRWVLGLSAGEVFQQALPALEAGGKQGWVEFRADWCGWCRKMEKFFQSSDAADTLRKYYMVISIDQDKNAGWQDLGKRLGWKGDGGIPWFAVVDGAGKPLANSDGPKGNIGFPDNDVERAHFLSVLKATARGITPAELQLVETALKAK